MSMKAVGMVAVPFCVSKERADPLMFDLGRELFGLMLRSVKEPTKITMPMEWINSHPETKERFDDITKRLEKMPGGCLIYTAAVEAATAEFAHRWSNDTAACFEFFMREQKVGNNQ